MIDTYHDYLIVGKALKLRDWLFLHVRGKGWLLFHGQAELFPNRIFMSLRQEWDLYGFEKIYPDSF